MPFRLTRARLVGDDLVAANEILKEICRSALRRPQQEKHGSQVTFHAQIAPAVNFNIVAVAVRCLLQDLGLAMKRCCSAEAYENDCYLHFSRKACRAKARMS